MKLFISFAVTSVFILLFIVFGLYLLALAICRRFLVTGVRQKKPKTALPEKIRPEDTSFHECIYTTQSPPSIILHIDEEPPEYYDIEKNRASPLPSYDSVIYNDNLQRSFSTLIGKTL